MTDLTSHNSPCADADIDKMFAVLGRYFVIFQSMEGKLEEILLLAWGSGNFAASQVKLARMRNVDKIDAVHDLVLKSPCFSRVHTRPEWCLQFEQLIHRLHDERNRRNKLMHSQYLFDFVKIGYPPLRSLRTKGATGLGLDQEYLTETAQDDLLHRLAELAADVNFLHVQLVHDHNAPAPAPSPPDGTT